MTSTENKESPDDAESSKEKKEEPMTSSSQNEKDLLVDGFKEGVTAVAVATASNVAESNTTIIGKSTVEETSNNSDDEEEEAACCLCHCGIDCSDRALFFPTDREKELADDADGTAAEDYYFTLKDPYLPEQLYDRHNTLVYCDGCDRLYHQKCHFVPLFTLPRGKWFCMLCTGSAGVDARGRSGPGRKKKVTKQAAKKNVGLKKSASAGATDVLTPHAVQFNPNEWDPKILKQVFQSPTIAATANTITTSVDDDTTTPATTSAKKDNATTSTPETTDIIPKPELTKHEQTLELQLYHAKALQWNLQWKRIKQTIDTQLSTIRKCQGFLETFTSSRKNRQYFLTWSSKATAPPPANASTTTNKTNTPTKKGSKYAWYQQHSQELAQTVLRYATAQWKIRTLLLSMDQVRTYPVMGGLANDQLLSEWCQIQQALNSVTVNNMLEHLFPHGIQYYMEHKRVVPRTRELQEQLLKESQESSIPTTIEIKAGNSKDNDKHKCNNHHTRKPKKEGKKDTGNKKKKSKNDNDNDDNSGITLDDLKCCICFIGDSTDDNDVLLCDCHGCYRAFHMKCVVPNVTAKEIEDETQDWFCPFCTHYFDSIRHIQSVLQEMDGVMEDAAATGPPKGCNSVESWSNIEQVFPDAEWDYEQAQLFHQRQHSADTQKLLQKILGEEFFMAANAKNSDPTNGGGNKKQRHPVGSDSEDEEDYSLFDEESFKARKRRKAKESNGDGGDHSDGDGKKVGDADNDDEEDDDASGGGSISTRSSQATLVGMSSVEYDISKDELDALSLGSDEEENNGDDNSSANDSDNSSNGQRPRRSRRLKDVDGEDDDESTSSRSSLGADFNERNILKGKRRRTAVDYRKLNDALFGDISASEQKKLDGGADFRAPATPKPRKRKASPAKKSSQPSRKRKATGKRGSNCDDNEAGEEPAADNSVTNGNEDDGDEEQEEPSENGDGTSMPKKNGSNKVASSAKSPSNGKAKKKTGPKQNSSPP